MRTELFGAFLSYCSSQSTNNFRIFCWFGPQMAMRMEFAAQIMKKIWIYGFFLVWAASLFALRTVGAQINKHVLSRKILFDPHRLIANKIAYSFCWRERKRKYVLHWQMACSKWKWTSIATVPDLCPTAVKILTHLISRYQLPLMVIPDNLDLQVVNKLQNSFAKTLAIVSVIM